MRTFIAADIPPEILQKIDKVLSYFKTQTPPRAIKWVEVANLHLTVKFIGELREKDLPKAKSLIKRALDSTSSFKISVESLGMFPNADRPRVIWLGVQPGEPLAEIHKALDQSLEEIGLKPEKRAYHPHLTLGRVRRQVETDNVKQIGETLSQFKVDSLGKAEITEINLYQSQLTPKGPIYTRLLAVPLHQV